MYKILETNFDKLSNPTILLHFFIPSLFIKQNLIKS